jgi:hypothetical protein
MVREVVSDRLRDFIVRAGGADRILHLGSRTTGQIDIVINLNDGNWYELTLAPIAGDSLRLIHQSATYWQPPLLLDPVV